MRFFYVKELPQTFDGMLLLVNQARVSGVCKGVDGLFLEYIDVRHLQKVSVLLQTAMHCYTLLKPVLLLRLLPQ